MEDLPYGRLAATMWDEARVERLGRLLAFETPGAGVDVGESSLLTARLGAAFARGLHVERAWTEDEIASEWRCAGAASCVLARNHGALLPLAGGSLRRAAMLGADPRTLDGLRSSVPFEVAQAEGLEQAVALARDADLALVAGYQSELIRRVNEVQPRTIVVVDAGAPAPLPWLDEVPAVLLAWLGAPEAGGALADVLLGADEPGGRLPAAWPGSPLPLGHGLGYTSWEYLAMDGPEVRIVNAGTRRGREVVQVYASGRLAGFAAIEADAGEEVVVEIGLEPGGLGLHAGRSAADLRV